MSPDNLPTYISLNQAATRYGVNITVLRRAVESGIIKAVKIDAEVMVADEDVRMITERNTLWDRVKHLDGNSIGLEESCRKYRLSTTSVYRWIGQGYVRVLSDQRGGGRGRKRTLNEADVAYASLVAETRGRQQGKRIFTREFIPLHLAV